MVRRSCGRSSQGLFSYHEPSHMQWETCVWLCLTHSHYDLLKYCSLTLAMWIYRCPGQVKARWRKSDSFHHEWRKYVIVVRSECTCSGRSEMFGSVFEMPNAGKSKGSEQRCLLLGCKNDARSSSKFNVHRYWFVCNYLFIHLLVIVLVLPCIYIYRYQHRWANSLYPFQQETLRCGLSPDDIVCVELRKPGIQQTCAYNLMATCTKSPRPKKKI